MDFSLLLGTGLGSVYVSACGQYTCLQKPGYFAVIRFQREKTAKRIFEIDFHISGNDILLRM